MDAIGMWGLRNGLQRLLPVVLLIAATTGASASESPPPPPPPPPPAGDFVPPQAVQNPPPHYPPGSADAEEAGTVVLVLRLEADGTISEVVLDRTSGYPRLDAAAVEAAAGWQFTPAQEDGKPVAVKLRVPVTFRTD